MPTDGERSWMTAIAFAEEGEFETAREYLPRLAPCRLAAWIERHLVAAAFAEEGLHEDAVIASGDGPRRFGEEALDALLRAHGVRMLCGALSPAALAARR
jgi:hypothetical protein